MFVLVGAYRKLMNVPRQCVEGVPDVRLCDIIAS